MKYNFLGNTGVVVSEICFGTMTFGGGSGIWGTVPMTPHPALKEEDIRTMVNYILSLKK